ncbi:E3 ubiquitin-protein ligase RNF43 [Collichthys lucidus]|uniref:E3 ubiquitin-protein ligase RNF43 n=1 Tax=Collichthys lucidus TaxID=240159 RepID=A0A4U5VA20_COLLU|nr:E3 ubiquitin-protein ligase RNF43 [Collichthys lucidus]
MDTIIQIVDEVMETPPKNCLVRAVPLEKTGPIIVSTSSTSTNTITSRPASTMQDNPLCDTPIIISTLGSVYVDKEQEELVLSVPEKMPEDAIIQSLKLKEEVGRVFIQTHFTPPSPPCFEVHHVRPGTAAAAEAMTVPQRRLAGLWPWLLMAALQVVLGQPGLESERPALRAVIKVALLNHEPTGKPITLEGVFVGGSAGFAEGKLMQVSKELLTTPHFPLSTRHVMTEYLNSFNNSDDMQVFLSVPQGTECLLVPPRALRCPRPLSACFPGSALSAGRLGTRDGRAVGALRENIKVRPVPNEEEKEEEVDEANTLDVLDVD